MTTEILARHVLCFVGRWSSFASIERVVAKLGGAGWTLDRTESALEPDDRMPVAFAVSADRVRPSWTADDERAVLRHTAVAYVLSPPMAPGAAFEISRTALAIIDAVLARTGTAAKAESAGIAHGAKRWRTLARNARRRDPLVRASALHEAFVRRPIQDRRILYSCGMHLLGERDAEVVASRDVLRDVTWLDMLAIYLLAEKPARGVHAGEGFRLRPRGERRVLRARPCTRYADDDFFYNPHGYWRLTTPR